MSERWKMTAQARLLMAFALGFAYGAYAFWILTPPSVAMLAGVAFNVAIGIWNARRLSAKRWSGERDVEFVVRLAKEYGIEVQEGDASATHRTYVVDLDTFRRIKEHEFLSGEVSDD